MKAIPIETEVRLLEAFMNTNYLSPEEVIILLRLPDKIVKNTRLEEVMDSIRDEYLDKIEDNECNSDKRVLRLHREMVQEIEEGIKRLRGAK